MPHFDEQSRKLRDADAPVCRFLRTKALDVYGQQTPDAYVTSGSAGYQCLRTQFVTGPDTRPCLPEDCQPDRDCFSAR